MFYFLGAQDTNEKCFYLHHPKVIFNEACIPYGANLLCEGALQLLNPTLYKLISKEMNKNTRNIKIPISVL